MKARGDPFQNISLVIYPAYLEYQPRTLLKAIASGIPLLATTGCGLTDGEGVTLVSVGDYEALKDAACSVSDCVEVESTDSGASIAGL